MKLKGRSGPVPGNSGRSCEARISLVPFNPRRTERLGVVRKAAKERRKRARSGAEACLIELAVEAK